ncbi:hypothetical protein ASD45_19790 [Pseudolabrys sp. Root1462]|jgi:hypothetical protein|uniref:hypothetical protein n=1 Tax=Pseudolabrys sp. Root1462 TaxID=1736466 RepID=UPI0007038E04|nr:hypothetical protein [Pseudolabrys sp. Root1462]KQY98205.1 hypothetical protein ASD45_19790 [Pseudolabrys sp. Root1462]
MTNNQRPDFLDAALKRVAAPREADDAAIARVLGRLRPPLPRQKVAFWRWPAVLLDWQFTPSWSRMAALACSALLGFYIGIAGLDRSLDQLDQTTTVASNADGGFFVFDPEPLSGARP